MRKNKFSKWIFAILFIFNTTAMSAQSDNHTLDAREQNLAAISAWTATGNLEGLEAQLHAGLDAGLTVNEIKEALVQLYAYCGFPRSLNAINTFMRVLEERKNRGITDVAGKEATPLPENTDTYERGRKTLEVLTNTPQAKPAPGFGEFAPRIDAFLKEHLFADIFDSDVLTYQQRELVTIAALAAVPGAEPQLQAHIGMGINTGITADQIKEVLNITKKVGSKEQAAISRAMTTQDNASLFSQGEKLSGEWFVGNAFLQPLLARDKNNDFVLGSVTFEPGARTNWHSHPKGQVLIVTEGIGWYQEKGKSAQHIKKGDVINIPENIEHWHGASAAHKMVHLAITNYLGETNAVWLQPVSSAEYDGVNQ